MIDRIKWKIKSKIYTKTPASHDEYEEYDY